MTDIQIGIPRGDVPGMVAKEATETVNKIERADKKMSKTHKIYSRRASSSRREVG